MVTSTRTSSRTDILDRAVDLIRAGGALSLESVARAAGLTKPGLMYHFPTKHALMAGLVDHVVDGYEKVLLEALPPGEAGALERLQAYVDWAFTAHIDESDLVVFTDPRLRAALTARWSERMRHWVAVPADLPPARRARLLSARLIADGSWFADASGLLPLAGRERPDVWAVARQLLADAP